MVGVVRIVVNRKVHIVAVEAIDQHTLLVEVGKADRSYDLVHTEFFRPLLHRFEKRFCDGEVVDNVVARETQLLHVLLCVVSLVEYRGDSSHDLAVVVVAKKHFTFGVTVSVVDRGVEFVVFVGYKLRHGVSVALV